MTGATARIAIYDLDRTVTRVATWTPFLLFAIRKRAPWRLALLPFALAAAAFEAAGAIDRRALKQTMHGLALGRLSTRDADRLAAAFAATFGERHIRADARARIAADRAAGYRIVIATAAHEFYAGALARAVGADALIATRATRRGDVILPRIDGDNLYGAAKLAAIRDWFTREGISRDAATVRFYTDHASDAPTLDWADEPFAAAPSRKLRRLAEARCWPILDWR